MRSLLLGIALCSLCACVSGLSIDDAGCPCAAGYVCCPALGLCLPEHETCPAAADAGTSGDDGEVPDAGTSGGDGEVPDADRTDADTSDAPDGSAPDASGADASNLDGAVLCSASSVGAASTISANRFAALGDGSSGHVSISADGAVVAFVSLATNLAAFRPPARALHVKMMGTGQMRRIGPAADLRPAVSGDGRVVAYVSPSGAVMVYDLVAQRLERADVATDGTAADRSADSVTISGDGSLVAFTTAATNLDTRDHNRVGDVYIRDRSNNTTALISVDVGGGNANGVSSDVRLSTDGRFLAFRSAASNLVSGDTNQAADVFLADRASGAIQSLSVDGAGAALARTIGAPAISADGEVIAFVGVAQDQTWHVFVRSRTATTSASIDFVAPFDLDYVALSGDASTLAFTTGAFSQLQIFDLRTGRRRQRSGVEAALSGDGSVLAYATELGAAGQIEVVGAAPCPLVPATNLEGWTWKELPLSGWDVVDGTAAPNGTQILRCCGQATVLLAQPASLYSSVDHAWHVLPDPPAPYGVFDLAGASSIWTSTAAFVFGGSGSVTAGAAAYRPVLDSWVDVQLGGVSSQNHAALVWTGREVIAWGGGPPAAGTGGRWSPSTQAMIPLPPAGPPASTAPPYGAWTGSEALFWSPAGGGMFDPLLGMWLPMSAVDAPTSGKAVWCGDRLVVWDGSQGAAYSPITDRWTRTATLGGGGGAALVWTGHEVLDLTFGRTAAYDPQLDQWRPLAVRYGPYEAVEEGSDLQVLTSSWFGGEALLYGARLASDDGALFGP